MPMRALPISPPDGPICAFGHDEWVLEENLRLYGVEGARALPVFQDLRTWFAAHNVDPRAHAFL